MALVPTRSGRRYSTHNPLLDRDDYRSPTPFDTRAQLPLEARKVRREVLLSGRVVIHYEDPPLGAEQQPVGGDSTDLPPLPEPPTRSPSQQAQELDEKRGLR